MCYRWRGGKGEERMGGLSVSCWKGGELTTLRWQQAESSFVSHGFAAKKGLGGAGEVYSFSLDLIKPDQVARTWLKWHELDSVTIW